MAKYRSPLLTDMIALAGDRSTDMADLRRLKQALDATIARREKERIVEVRQGWSPSGRLILKVVPCLMSSPTDGEDDVEGLDIFYWHRPETVTPRELRIPTTLADQLATAIRKASLP